MIIFKLMFSIRENVFKGCNSITIDIFEKHTIDLKEFLLDDSLLNCKNMECSLYEDKVNGVLTSSEFIIKDTNMIEIEKLKNKLLEIETKIIGLNIEKSKREENKKLFEKYRDIKALNRVVLDSFIKRIVIGKANLETSERPIKIEWNFQNI